MPSTSAHGRLHGGRSRASPAYPASDNHTSAFVYEVVKETNNLVALPRENRYTT
jgi:hypothetical protein